MTDYDRGWLHGWLCGLAGGLLYLLFTFASSARAEEQVYAMKYQNNVKLDDEDCYRVDRNTIECVHRCRPDKSSPICPGDKICLYQHYTCQIVERYERKEVTP